MQRGRSTGNRGVRRAAAAASYGGAHVLTASLAFSDSDAERNWVAEQFRGAYILHLLYSSSLLIMFAAGALLDAEGFRFASLTLGPCFAGVIVIRVGLHHSADECWAQRVGTRLMCAVDASIWVMSAWVFHQRPIRAPVLILGMYSIAMVLYPIILMIRTFSHAQRSAVVAIAVAATTASPVWVEGMTQVEFIATNLSALLTGTCFAYLLEKLKRENEQMHVADLNKSRESAAADSHLNHVLKNKIILIDHWIELTRKDIARRSPSGAAPAAAEGTADRMLADAQQVLQGCVTWIHRREFFMQLARGMYKTSQQHVAVHDLLRAFAGRGVRLQIDCPPGVWIDTAATALALEEAMSNARKYGDEGSDIQIRMSAASVGAADDGDELAVLLEVDSLDPAGSRHLTPHAAERAFEHGSKGERAARHSDGIGLPAARAAAQAALGEVGLEARRGEDGRMHTVFRLRMPARRGAQNAACGGDGGGGDGGGSSPLRPQRALGLEAAAEGETAARRRPYCVVVDDDELVQVVMAAQLKDLGTHAVFTLGVTHEEQFAMEDVIMGVRHPEALALELPPPHAAASVAVIDLNLTLPPPCPDAPLRSPHPGLHSCMGGWRGRCPEHLLARLRGGEPPIPSDGFDLARRWSRLDLGSIAAKSRLGLG